MKEIYKNALDKATLPKDSKENLKSLYDKVNQEDNVVSIEKKRNVKKPLAFVAAGLVCAVAVGSTFALGQFDNNKSSKDKTSGNSNSFVLNVNAAEISRKTADSNKANSKDSQVSLDGSGCYIVNQGGDPYTNDADWNYEFTFPVNCKGKNIDEITYTVSKGDLVVYAHGTERPEYFDKNKIVDEVEQKKSQTVSYKNLSKYKTVYLDLYGDSSSLSKSEIKTLDKGFMPESNDEQYQKAMSIFMKDLKITVKAKFTDGTTKEETIVGSSKFISKEESEELEKRISESENGKDGVEETTEVEVSKDNTNESEEKVLYTGFEVAK